MSGWWKRKTRSRASVPQDLRCSFCGKRQEQVRKLIAGPKVFICDECIDVCVEILAEDAGMEGTSKESSIHKTPDKKTPERETANCSLCGTSVLPTEMLPVKSRGVLCGACVDAIEDVLSKGRPKT